MSPQRMHGSDILEIISILNCFFFQLKLECTHRRCKSAVIFEIISIMNCFFSRNLNVPKKIMDLSSL